MNIEKSLIVLSLTAISSYIIIKFFNKEKKKKLHNVGKIHSLYIYPIKSMKGIEVCLLIFYHINYTFKKG